MTAGTAAEAAGRAPPPRIVAVNHTGLCAGAEAVMLRMLEGAVARGWSAVAACPPGLLADRARDRGITHVALPDLMLPGWPRPLAVAALAARHAKAARRLRTSVAAADLVVANGARVLPTLRLARLPCRVVWLAQSVVVGRVWRLLVSACGPGVDLVVAVSDAVAETVDAALPVTVVRNGTPWPVTPAPPAPPQPPVVGCSALLTPWKGQHVLLEAASRLPPEVTVELQGGSFPKDRGYVEALHRRAAQPDLMGRIRFLGHVEDTLADLRRWSVAIVASVEPEAGPLSLLEAMSVGVPVVATDHGGSPEVLDGAGLLVPVGDAEAMAAAIRLLLNDVSAHQRCARAGRRAVAAGLSLDGQLGKLLDVLLGRPPAR